MKTSESKSRRTISTISRYFLAGGAVVVAHLFSAWLSLPPLYILAIIVSAWGGGFRVGLFAIALSTIGIFLKIDVAGLNLAVYLGSYVLAAVTVAWLSAKHYEIRDELSLFRSLVDNANDSIEVIDPATGHFVDVNERACIAHGYTRDEYLKLRVQDLDPHVAELPWMEIVNGLRMSSFRVIESHHRRKDGSLFPVEVNVTYVQLKRDYMVAVVRDTTERKRADEKIEQAQRDLRLVIDTIPTMAWTVRADGSVDFLNQRWLDYTGLTNEEYLKNPNRVVHPDDVAEAVERWRVAMASGTAYHGRMRLLRADGEYRWFQVITEPLRDTQQRIIKWYGTSTDITDQLKAEEELRKTQSDLVRAIRASVVGELTASIAHEVNQPLAAVVTNANASLNWMARTPPNFDEARDALLRIIREGQRASEVVSHIRALLKKEEPFRTEVDLSDIIKEIATLAEFEIRKRNVLLQTDIALNLPAITADRVQIQQVILNLLMNALDAHNDSVGRQRTVSIAASIRESGICVLVEDNAIGIEPERMQRLFEAFYTTKPGGLGMGLAICRSIIESHGGKIWAESAESTGSRFTFSLPISTKECNEKHTR